MSALASQRPPAVAAYAESVLCVDDDPVVQIMLEEVIRLSGARYHAATTASEALEKLGQQRFGLILLDRRLPDGDGLLLMETVRQKCACPVIVLSEMGCTQDRQLGLGLGATEYIGKPFNPAELVGRVRFMLERESRRLRTDDLRPVEFAGLSFTPRARRLVVNGKTSFLPPAESRLLAAFLANVDTVLSRDDLTAAVSGRDWCPGDRTTDVLVARLRKRLAPSVAEIITVHRLGYCLTGPDPSN